MSEPKKRHYTAAEVAEAVLVYDELRRIDAVDKGRLNKERIAAHYPSEWNKSVEFDRRTLGAIVWDESDGEQP